MYWNNTENQLPTKPPSWGFQELEFRGNPPNQNDPCCSTVFVGGKTVRDQPANQPRILVASGARALALFSPSCCAVVALPLADVKSTRMDAPQRCEVPGPGRIWVRVFLDPPYKDETSGGVREQCPNTDFHNGFWKTQVFFTDFLLESCWWISSWISSHRVENQKGKCHPLEI